MNLVSRASTTALSVTFLALALSTIGCANETASENDSATADEGVATTSEALSTETNDGFWIDQNPSYPGVYYKKLGGGCYRGGSSSGTYNCKVATLRTDVSYVINADPRWPGVYYDRVNGTCPYGGTQVTQTYKMGFSTVTVTKCRVVAFDQSYLDYGVSAADDNLMISGTVGTASVNLWASRDGDGAHFEGPLHELGGGWHCGDRKDNGGSTTRDCIQIDILVYDQPNKISFRARGKAQTLWLGTWGDSKALFDKTYSYTDPFAQ
jgi:hypothetical protein